jgi:hypothetical protein
MEYVAEVYTIGAKKYADRNWENGITWNRVYGALRRHAEKWWGGERLDPKDGQHHLASVVWCALTLMEFERTHPGMDERAPRNKPYCPQLQEPMLAFDNERVFPWPKASNVYQSRRH